MRKNPLWLGSKAVCKCMLIELTCQAKTNGHIKWNRSCKKKKKKKREEKKKEKKRKKGRGQKLRSPSASRHSSMRATGIMAG